MESIKREIRKTAYKKVTEQPHKLGTQTTYHAEHSLNSKYVSDEIIITKGSEDILLVSSNGKATQLYPCESRDRGSNRTIMTQVFGVNRIGNFVNMEHKEFNDVPVLFSLEFKNEYLYVVELHD